MDVWECALGFMNAQALLTAEEMGLFDALDRDPRNAGEVAEALDVPEDSAARLLTMLCALGFVERRESGAYANTAEAAAKLVRGRPGYVGAMFRHLRHDLYPVWGHLGGALRDGEAQWHRAFPGHRPPTASMYEDPAALRAFMEGMHAITYEAGCQFAAKAPEIAGVGRMVDVGGASGAFLIALAQRFPGLRGEVFDLPPVRPVAEDFFRRHRLDGRLGFAGGSFWDDPLPAGADAYGLGFILHDWDDAGGDRILARVADAAPPGALLIIGEYLLDEARTGPLVVARQDLNMLVAARGRERTAAEYAEWVARFGFALERVQPTRSRKAFLIARRV